MRTWWRQRDRRVAHLMRLALFLQSAIAVTAALLLVVLLGGVTR